MNHIPTMTHLYSKPIEVKPILSSIPPADWCQHNTVRHLCAFCSKMPFLPVKKSEIKPADTPKPIK
jgi:hypothetical protein